MNLIKHYLEYLSINKKHIAVRITSLSANVTSVTFYVSGVYKRES